MAWAHFNIEEYGAMFLVVAGLAPCVLGSSREARDHCNALWPMPIEFSCRNALWPMPIGFSFRPFIFFLSSLVAARSCLWAGLPLSALFILRQSRYANRCRAGQQLHIMKPGAGSSAIATSVRFGSLADIRIKFTNSTLARLFKVNSRHDGRSALGRKRTS